MTQDSHTISDVIVRIGYTAEHDTYRPRVPITLRVNGAGKLRDVVLLLTVNAAAAV